MLTPKRYYHDTTKPFEACKRTCTRTTKVNIDFRLKGGIYGEPEGTIKRIR